MDEHSVMTYLSQFPKAKLKPGAPLRPKLNPKKARAYGPGRRTLQNASTALVHACREPLACSYTCFLLRNGVSLKVWNLWGTW